MIMIRHTSGHAQAGLLLLLIVANLHAVSAWANCAGDLQRADGDSLSVSSVLGAGTTVLLTLPAAGRARSRGRGLLAVESSRLGGLPLRSRLHARDHARGVIEAMEGRLATVGQSEAARG